MNATPMHLSPPPRTMLQRAAAWYTAAYRRLDSYSEAERLSDAYERRMAIAARYARLVTL